MKQLKRILALVMALSMLFLTACGSTESSDDEDTETETETTVEDTAEDTSAEAEETVSTATDSTGWSYGTTLTVAMNAEPVCLVYEYNVMTKPDFNIVRLLHSALWEYNQDGELVMMLAEDYEWVDSLHIRIKIREGVIAYNGTELTAEDVLWCLEVGEENAGSANFTAYFDASESYVEDTYTIVIGLSKVNSDIFRAFSETYIISKSCVEELGGLQEASLNPLCNVGRYNFVEWVQGQYVLLERNENYWGKDEDTAGSYYQYIKLTWISDSASRVMTLQSGDVDVALSLSYSDCAAFLDSDELTVVGLESSRCVGFSFNCTEDSIFYDANLRSALYELIDPEACIEIIYGAGNSTATEIFCSTTSSWYVSGLDPDRAVDVEAAKEYLAAAGYPDGFSFTLTLEPDDSLQQVAEYLQAVFLEVGIEMEINSPELSEYFVEIYAGDFDVFLTQSGRFIDVGQAVQAWDGRISFADAGGGTGVQDERIQELCDIIYSSIDEEEIEAAYTELSQIVFDEHYSIGICNGVNYIMMDSDLTGFAIGSNGNDHLQFIRPIA